MRSSPNSHARTLRAAKRLGAMLLAAAASVAAAAPVGPGTPLPPIEVADQFDRPVAITPTTRWLVFAGDKSASGVVERALERDNGALLTEAHAVYVADISAMPAMVTRMFALPKLRERAYPVGLARDAAAVADLPRTSGAVAVIGLTGLRVASVDWARDEAELRRLLARAGQGAVVD